MARSKSTDRDSTRKVTPPEPSYMDNKHFAAYLAGLRDNRVSRPGGARPLPVSISSSPVPLSSPAREQMARNTVMVTPTKPQGGTSLIRPETPASTSGHQRNDSGGSSGKARSIRPGTIGSVRSRYSTISMATTSGPGRDYFPDDAANIKPLRTGEVVPTATYMERGSRWMEKEEAVSLRAAMDDKALIEHIPGTGTEATKTGQDDEVQDDEARLYNAALDEAAELVWRHQNGIKSPEPGAPYRYKNHLRRDSYAHARTASVGRYGPDIEPTGLARDGYRSVSGSSSGSDGCRSRDSPRESLDGLPRCSVDSTTAPNSSANTAAKKGYGSINGKSPRAASGSTRRRSSMRRDISGGIQKPFSGDQIWEESESDAPKNGSATLLAPASELAPVSAYALASSAASVSAEDATEAPRSFRLRLRDPPNRIPPTQKSDSEGDKSSPGSSPSKPPSRTEIHRNPPSQSRNPAYTTNQPSTSKPLGPRANDGSPRKMKGVEVRGDDIRDATSFKLVDRSRKLPTPSAVSDSPGRPIVSFDTNWKPPEEAATDVKPEPKEKFVNFPATGTRRDQERGDQAPAQSQSQSQYSSSNFKSQHQSQTQSQSQSFQSRPQLQPFKQGPSRPLVPAVSVTPTVQIQTTPKINTSANTPSIPSIHVDNKPVVRGPSRPLPAISVSADDDGQSPKIPSIVLPDDDANDSSSSDNPSFPIIVTPEPNPRSASRPSARPLPTPSKSEPHQRHCAQRQGHWSPSPGVVSRSTATCHECGFPIEGRFVALRGALERFHPQCFSCYKCGTSLEALEISPEPDSFREVRLDRIERRAAGETLDDMPGQTAEEDGDERLRFYCHLDWHELFAPRCKSCTTPIIGEHIVALGNHYHYGHFFCAECGDPFEHGMTHIEKDGYAWCVGCQTKRTERRAPKCRGCREPVVGSYIRALGGEWHDECFRCAQCHGGFDDGQIFPVADDRVLCTACRMRELKA